MKCEMRQKRGLDINDRVQKEGEIKIRMKIQISVREQIKEK